jgi:hypothetical protein
MPFPPVLPPRREPDSPEGYSLQSRVSAYLGRTRRVEANPEGGPCVTSSR